MTTAGPRHRLRLGAALAAAALLAACAGAPAREGLAPAPVSCAGSDSASIKLVEAGADEIVIVINNNAALGNHAGLFLGDRLSDPAGSYRHLRSASDGWQQPSLKDYVAFQRSDGERVEAYRFRLDESTRAEIAARLPEADAALPLFCGSAVNNAIAGSGPFAAIGKVWWTSPAAVAAELDAIIAADPALGRCELPDASPCRKPGARAASDHR